MLAVFEKECSRIPCVALCHGSVMSKKQTNNPQTLDFIDKSK